jgi:hypothetical protein
MSNLTKVYSPSGRYFTVAREHAPRFQGFLSELEKAGYNIDQSQSGGYNYRTIAGSNKLSNHAHGAALDINWSQNPRDGSIGHIGKTLGADRVRSLASKYGLRWGGDYKNPDAMHFEVHGDWDGGKDAPQGAPTIMQGDGERQPMGTGWRDQPPMRSSDTNGNAFASSFQPAQWKDPSTVQWSDGNAFSFGPQW